MTERDAAIEAATDAVIELPDGTPLETVVRAAIAAYEQERAKGEAVGVRCMGCGSSWTDKDLERERAANPDLISCCPERDPQPVYLHPSPAADVKALRQALTSLVRWAERVDGFDKTEWSDAYAALATSGGGE